MSSRPTAARVRELLHYEPATGIFIWRVKPVRRIIAGSRAGSLSHGYRKIGIDGVECLEHRLAWVYMTGEWPEREIDHRNMRRDDNRWRNLRQATSTQNKANMNRLSTNTSGVRGVTWFKRDSKWAAQIHIRRKHVHLGLFDKKEDAAAAYAKAAKATFGEYARIS